MLHRCHRRECQCVSCTIAADSFDRANGSTVDGWTEVAGDWSIDGNALKPPAASGNLLKFNTPDPDTDDGVIWSTTFTYGGLADGVIRWLVDFVDADNHHIVELTPIGGSAVTLQLLKREGGSETALGSAYTIEAFNASASHTMAVCWGFQGIVPECSGGTVGWVWTLDYYPNGDPGWQPRSMTGACQDGRCSDWVPPPVTGTEIEGDEATTACSPLAGGEGDSIFGIVAALDGAHSVGAAASSLGGLHVGLGTENAGDSFRFDNAELGRLTSSCPRCAPPCSECSDGEPPAIQVDLEGEFQDVACEGCDLLFIGTFICTYYSRCEWRYYFPSGFCDYDYLRVIILPGTLIVNMIDKAGNDDNFWFFPLGEFSTPANCAATLDRLEVPRGAGYGDKCYANLLNTPAAVRCFVTALAA